MERAIPITWRGRVNRLVRSFLGQSAGLGPDLPTAHQIIRDVTSPKITNRQLLFESGSSRAMRPHLHPAIRVNVFDLPEFSLRCFMSEIQGVRSGTMAPFTYQSASYSPYTPPCLCPTHPTSSGSSPHAYHSTFPPRPYHGHHSPLTVAHISRC